MRLKRTAAAAGLVVASLMVTACGLGAPDTTDDSNGDQQGAGTDEQGEDAGDLTGEITFTTLQLSPTFDDYLNDMVAEFESMHEGATVRWIDVPFEGAAERLLADASAGQLADVINLNPDLAYPLVTDDRFINLDEAAADVKDDFVVGAWDAFRYPGKEGAYGFPWYLSTGMSIYNSAILEEAGLDTEDLPETFDERHEWALQIAENTDSYAVHPALEDGFVIDLVKRDVQIANDDLTEATFNTPVALAYVEELRELYEAGAIAPDAVTQGHRHEVDAYQAGNLGFFMRGPNFLNIVSENAPDVGEVSIVGPQIVGEANVTSMSVMGIFVPESSEHPELALEFGKFVTNAENQLELSRLTPVFPSIESALQDDMFMDIEGDSPVDQATKIAAEQLPIAENVRPVYVDEEVNQAIIQNIQGAILGQLSPEEALEAAEAEVTEILQRRA